MRREVKIPLLPPKPEACYPQLEESSFIEIYALPRERRVIIDWICFQKFVEMLIGCVVNPSLQRRQLGMEVSRRHFSHNLFANRQHGISGRRQVIDAVPEVKRACAALFRLVREPRLQEGQKQAA